MPDRHLIAIHAQQPDDLPDQDAVVGLIISVPTVDGDPLSRDGVGRAMDALKRVCEREHGQLPWTGMRTIGISIYAGPDARVSLLDLDEQEFADG